MQIVSSFSPVALSYVAALRGVTPRQPGVSFVHATVGCEDPERAVCLAASNPEGTFFVFVSCDADKPRGEGIAKERSVSNITFLTGTPGRILSDLTAGILTLPDFDYLCVDESRFALSAVERQALFDLAARQVQPSGLFTLVYQARQKEDDTLRFLVRELSPQMTPEQARDFLGEIYALGRRYLAANPLHAAALDVARATQNPQPFFDFFKEGATSSPSFDTFLALAGKGFSYGGDADLSTNYMELSVSVDAQRVVLEAESSPLYQQVKDFALHRPLRSDIWCRQPATQTADMAELFGGFSYSIATARSQVPSVLEVEGTRVDLSSPLYTKLMDLMAMMPVRVGDFLAHPEGKDFAPLDVVGAIQVLVACKIAQPVRGGWETGNVASVATPRFAGACNRFVDSAPVTAGETWMASPALGCPVRITAREALVMQALARGGLANSPAALLPELERLAASPSEATRVMDSAAPTAETAEQMIQETVNGSIVQWYAYGLLEAA